ncbi:MAG: hypothetical protein AB8B81_03470 [Halioglobus sp.]
MNRKRTRPSLSPDQGKVKKLYNALNENQVAITSTLAVFASGFTEHNPLDPGTIDALSPAAIGAFMDYRSKTTKPQQDLDVKASDVLNAGMALELGFYRADLVLVDGNPDLDIEDIRKVETVHKAGVPYDSEELREAVRDMVGGPVGRR